MFLCVTNWPPFQIFNHTARPLMGLKICGGVMMQVLLMHATAPDELVYLKGIQKEGGNYLFS
jgi:hypothetical protein